MRPTGVHHDDIVTNYGCQWKNVNYYYHHIIVQSVKYDVWHGNIIDQEVVKDDSVIVPTIPKRWKASSNNNYLTQMNSLQLYHCSIMLLTSTVAPKRSIQREFFGLSSYSFCYDRKLRKEDNSQITSVLIIEKYPKTATLFFWMRTARLAKMPIWRSGSICP